MAWEGGEPADWAAWQYLHTATRGRGEPWSCRQVDSRFLAGGWIPLKAPAESLRR